MTPDQLKALISDMAHKAIDAGIASFSNTLAAAIIAAQQPPPPPLPSGQHPTLLDGYAKRPPFKVAGVDYFVGVPDGATLTDWQTLGSLAGVTVNTTAKPPYVRVDNTSGLTISGVDFSLHGGAVLFFLNCPGAIVRGNRFGGSNYVNATASLVFSDSPDFTVDGNTIDGGGANCGSSLVSTSGGGTITLSNNWLKNASQHVLEVMVAAGKPPYSIVYKGNFIEQIGMSPGSHPNFLQIEAVVPATFVAVQFNTSYSTPQVAGGEAYQFTPEPGSSIKNVTLAFNVIIAKPTPSGLPSMSRMIHGDGAGNLPAWANDNYVDRSGAYSWIYPATVNGWTLANNYDMTTAKLLTAAD